MFPAQWNAMNLGNMHIFLCHEPSIFKVQLYQEICRSGGRSRGSRLRDKPNRGWVTSYQSTEPPSHPQHKGGCVSAEPVSLTRGRRAAFPRISGSQHPAPAPRPSGSPRGGTCRCSRTARPGFTLPCSPTPGSAASPWPLHPSLLARLPPRPSGSAVRFGLYLLYQERKSPLVV